ncbi:MAG TPA: tyrosine--tRNA ligase [Patescibacteria group bacterium]|nr:tyrosine--tRNA ligase [Patescibacteria group bacterium]
MDKITELLTRGVVNIISDKDSLAKKLTTGEKLNIYLGIDPTATHIHLGHAVPLRKLQTFAKLGHHVKFLIGDFTALIGDTSDKDTERPQLTKEQIEENFQTYKKQAEKVLDFSQIEIVYNSEWLSKLDFVTTVKLCRQFSLNDFVSRELIKKRLNNNQHITLLEEIYPVMQGYDSYHMDTDLQIGGADQTFNMQAGRTLQKNWRGKESFVMSTDYLVGTDGRKMSKSWGNAIWLDDTPEDMYAKVMAINDELIIQYYTLATEISLEEIKSIETKLTNGEHPMSVKKNLANTIVTELYSEQKAQEAQNAFEKRVQQKEVPDEIEEVVYPEAFAALSITEVLVQLHLAQSISEAKRLIQQKGVKINTKAVQDFGTLREYSSGNEIFLQVGKFKFRKIVIK